MRIPWINASYSASLFDGRGKFILSTYFILSPCGDISMTPTPAPEFLLEPSKYMVHVPEVSGADGIWASIQSTRKSGRTWDFMAVRLTYVIPLGPSSMAHCDTRPVASGFVSMLFNGASGTTIIGCSMK